MKKTLSKTLLSLVGAAPLLASTLAAAPANAATSQTYQHGFYAQKSYSTLTACNTAKDAAPSTLKSYGAASWTVGLCHPVDMMIGKTHATGYLFEIDYKRGNMLWYGDKDFGAAPTSTYGQHSFKVTRVYDSQSTAASSLSNKTAYINSTVGKVTWSSGVKQDAVTKKWTYELDYNARLPFEGDHVQISEGANVTSPSLGVVTPIPTAPTTGAANDGIKNPGDATSGWNAPLPATPVEAVGVKGIDTSSHTVTNDWSGWKTKDYKFVIAKATEGTYYRSSKFSSQYSGASTNGLIRGAYHFANPSSSTGAAQADYFIANGGGWVKDGNTLPGTLDIEWNPYGNACYNMTQTQMRTWVNAFVDEYQVKTGVKPMVYTASGWWNQCVGGDFSQKDAPLWIPDYKATLGVLPSTWSGVKHAIWQTGALDSLGYDTDVYNGTLTSLKSWASTGVFK